MTMNLMLQAVSSGIAKNGFCIEREAQLRSGISATMWRALIEGACLENHWERLRLKEAYKPYLHELAGVYGYPMIIVPVGVIPLELSTKIDCSKYQKYFAHKGQGLDF